MNSNITATEGTGFNGPEKNITSLSITVPVIEEQLHIGKEVIEMGRVHISKKVLHEKFHADIPVFKEDVIVERRPVNKYIDGDAPGIRLDGDTTVIPIVKEVIIKRLLLVEELYITKQTTNYVIPVDETLRREEVTVTRTEVPE